MSLGPFLRLLVQTVEVGIELSAVDSPHTPAPQFDRREVSGPDQGVHLRNADAEICGHVLEREKSGLECGLRAGLGALRSALSGGHRPKIAPDGVRYLDLIPFAPVWIRS